MTTPIVLRSILEKEAKELKKISNLKWTKALDEASKKFGFHNYRHYQNTLKDKLRVEKSNQLIFSKRESPVIATRISGRWLDTMGDIENLKNATPQIAFEKLSTIIKSDSDMFNKVQAVKILFNNFLIPFDEILKLLNYFPPQHLEMVWPTIDLNNEIESSLLNYFKNEGKEKIKLLSSQSVIAHKVILRSKSYKLANDGLSISGDFGLFVKSIDNQISKMDILSTLEFRGEFDLDVDQSKHILIQTADLDEYYYL